MKSTWSFLKSVGFSQASTPFENVTTVTPISASSRRDSTRPGCGGRNQHLALSAAIALAGRDDALLLAAATDGVDGVTRDAGGLVDGGSCERGAIEGLDARDCLLRADSGRFLAATGDLVCTGPTLTNVGDLVLGLRATGGA